MTFVVCALFMYILWWDKPFDVQHKTIIPFPISMKDRIETLISRTEQSNPTHRVPDLTSELLMQLIGAEPSKRTYLQILAFYGTGTVFSVFNIIAWNWQFPSVHTRALWRSFVIAATSLGPLFFISILFWSVARFFLAMSEFVQSIRSREDPFSHPGRRLQSDIVQLRGGGNSRDIRNSRFVKRAFASLWVLCLITYTICRLALIILVFYCFCSMPATVYEGMNWVNYFPHFS
jgi:hypothetical protein